MKKAELEKLKEKYVEMNGYVKIEFGIKIDTDFIDSSCSKYYLPDFDNATISRVDYWHGIGDDIYEDIDECIEWIEENLENGVTFQKFKDQLCKINERGTGK